MTRRALPRPAHELPVPPGLQVRFVERGGELLAALSFEWRPVALPATLTKSERAVAEAIVAGDTSAKIARDRGTSERTIANQIASIFRKVGVHSRGELIARLQGDAVGLDP